MSTLGTISRRGFMLSSFAVAGGVAFGYYEYNRPPENPLDAADGQSVLNPYLIIDQDGVTIITPRAEMGQGVHTTLAALVAEELDLDFDQVRTAHGPASATYYNAAVAAAGLPFAEYKGGMIQELAGSGMEIAARFIGIQATGGSTTIRDGFDKMRMAGATARAMLVQAAAARLDLSPMELRTEAGQVIAPDGRRLAYVDLAADAATLQTPDKVTPKPASEWRLLGRSLPRVDMTAKVTGQAKFGIDTRLEGMRFAALRMNPRLGGKMAGYDDTDARNMRGVEKVVDLGDGVAVIADNTWRAMQAVAAINIEWADAPYPANTAAIFDAIQDSFDQSPNSTLKNTGDVEDTLAKGTIIEAEYRLPYLAHTTMEPMNATALLKDGALTIWSGNQTPTTVRDHAAKALGIDKEKVTVHTPYLGGGFGRRAETDATTLAARLAASMEGTPVQLTFSREEDTSHDFYRPAVIARMKGKATSDTITTLTADIAAQSVYRTQTQRVIGIAPPGPDKILVEGLFDAPYAIENHRVRGFIADMAVPVGSWRSVGHSHNCFVLESFIDELAHAAGADPVELRLSMMEGESPKAAAVLRRAAASAGWGQSRPEGTAQGVAFSYSFGTPTVQIVEVRQTDTGISIDKVWCVQDVGTALDPDNIKAQIMSGIAYGLSAAIGEEITFADGMVEQTNFDTYSVLRMDRMPEVIADVMASGGGIGGVGEPATPPIAPALANAIFALTGKRIRTLPMEREIDFA